VTSLIKVKNETGASGKSGTSSTSTNLPQPNQSSSPVIENLSQHLHGELPTYQPQPELQIASETVLILTISEPQQ